MSQRGAIAGGSRAATFGFMMECHLEQGTVLGVQVTVAPCDEVVSWIIALARSRAVSCVAAANAHLLGEASFDPSYASHLNNFDLVVPDGMPLVWALWLDGHDIHERIYGPYLMQQVLTAAPGGMKHYFFGGTTECLEKLTGRCLELNPGLTIVGAVSPPFGNWSVETEAQLIEGINQAGADFIWVALGGVKQETWIAQNRHRFHRGVFLAVGDAFALVAGMRNYAPRWMQRLGLTWVYRLLQEPRRLFARYLRYNVRFAAAFLSERFRKTHE